MSMREYAYYDYGLVFDDTTMQYIYNKRFDDPIEGEDVAMALCDSEFCICAGNFTGEAFPIMDNGNDDWNNSKVYSGDSVYYVPFDLYPSLFKAPYNNIEEIVEEFKKKVGEYMPEGYDYRANICHIIGTVFG